MTERRRRHVPRRADRARRRRRPDHHHRRRQRGRLRGGQGLPRRRGRVRQGRDAAGHAAGLGPGRRRRRSSRCPATPSAPWCRSRCSSARRCAPRWACPPRPPPASPATLPEDLTSPRGKRQFRRGVLGHENGQAGHQLRPARVASPALAGVGELPARDSARTSTELAAGSPCGCGICSSDRHVESGPQWPDPRVPPMPPAVRSSRFVELVRSTVPPVHPAGLPFIAGGLGLAAAGARTGAGCATPAWPRRRPVPCSSAIRPGCRRPGRASSSPPPTGWSR